MKIRNGFVSNSSSSSFVFIGVRLKDDESYDTLPDNQLDEWYSEYDTSEKYIGLRFSAGEGIKQIGFEEMLKAAEKVMLYFQDGRKLEVVYGQEYC